MQIQNSMSRFLIFCGALLAMPALVAMAGEDAWRVERAWVRATVPGQKVAAAYMDITANEGAALVAAASPYAARVELHSMAMEGGVMKMRAMETLPLPARQTVNLKPGGLHLMLFGLTRPVNAGESVPITLTVVDIRGRKSSLKIDAEVRPAGSDFHTGHKGHAGH